MNSAKLPILYSFRRCPYAMRARMALWVSGEKLVLREVKLGDKPAALRDASPKATVPVLVLPEGRVIDESLDIMLWALQRNDPELWLAADKGQVMGLIARADGEFKKALDRFKYPERFEIEAGYNPKAVGLSFLKDLEERLRIEAYLFRGSPSLADIAIFPFVRQFANVDKIFFDELDLPKLKLWLDSLMASERFERVMTKFEPWKPDQDALLWGSQI